MRFRLVRTTAEALFIYLFIYLVATVCGGVHIYLHDLTLYLHFTNFKA